MDFTKKVYHTPCSPIRRVSNPETINKPKDELPVAKKVKRKCSDVIHDKINEDIDLLYMDDNF